MRDKDDTNAGSAVDVRLRDAERSLVARDAELARYVAAHDGPDGAYARVQALEAEVTQLRAERDELHERWLGMRDCYDREVRRVGRAERLAHDRGEALERIAKNAEAWHGPEPDMGHVRALAVIASWAREGLAGVVPPEQAPQQADINETTRKEN